jgi:hypothetical protein
VAVVIFRPDAPLESIEQPILAKPARKQANAKTYLQELAKKELEKLRLAYGVPLSFTDDIRIPSDVLAKMQELEKAYYA